MKNYKAEIYSPLLGGVIVGFVLLLFGVMTSISMDDIIHHPVNILLGIFYSIPTIVSIMVILSYIISFVLGTIYFKLLYPYLLFKYLLSLLFFTIIFITITIFVICLTNNFSLLYSLFYSILFTIGSLLNLGLYLTLKKITLK